MPSAMHQSLVEMFRVRPGLAPEFVERAAHTKLPAFTSATPTEATLDQLVPTEFRADLVVELRDARGNLSGLIVIEVQLSIDPDKPWTWPVYVAALRARRRCPVWLLVVAPDAGVAAWARMPIELTPGVPGVVPAVLGPDETVPVTEFDVAVREPERTLLAAVAHARDIDAEGLLPAVVVVLHALDPEHRVGYLSMLLEALTPALRLRLRELMLNPAFANLKLPSPWQEELDAARASGKASAILSCLEARGVLVPDEVRAKVLACTDLPTLDRWIRRAATLKTAAAVVRDPVSKPRAPSR